MKRLAVGLGMVMFVVAGCGTAKTSGPPATGSPRSVATPASSAPATSATASSAPASSAPASSAPAGQSSPAGTTTEAAASPPQCSTSHLAGWIGQGGAAAGTIYYQLNLRNTGTAECFVYGYPGVSFVAGADHHQVGAAAERIARAERVVYLAPGQYATATLAVGDAYNYPPACDRTATSGFRVYPPDQTAALLVSHSDTACANSDDTTLWIYPLATAGSSPS